MSKSSSVYGALAVIIVAAFVLYEPLVVNYYQDKKYVEDSNKSKQINNVTHNSVKHPEDNKVDTIHSAVREISFSKLTTQLRSGVDINEAEAEDTESKDITRNAGSTPLILAVYNDYNAASTGDNLVKKLLIAGADVNAVDKLGRSPLLGACINGPGVFEILKAGADPQKLLKDGNTVLSACAKADARKFDVVLDASKPSQKELNMALINFVSNCGHNKYEEYSLSSVKKLLRTGANPNIRTSSSKPALLIASSVCSFKFVNALLEFGAYVDIRDSIFGYTAFSEAIDADKRNNYIELADAGASVNYLDVDGQTPIVKLLQPVVDSDENILVKQNSIALEEIMQERIKPLKKILLRYGGDPNLENEDGETPLLAAVRVGSVDAVKILLAVGADPVVLNKNDVSVQKLISVLDNGNEIKRIVNANIKIISQMSGSQRADYLYQKIPKDIPLLAILRINSPEGIDKLLKYGAEINQVDIIGRSPLSLACIKGNIEMFNYLINNGADVNITNSNGITPLMNCVSSEGKLINKLLESGALTKSVNKFGDSALSILVKKCSSSELSVKNLHALIDKGVVIAPAINEAEKLLLTTVIKRRCHKDMIKPLITAGANVDELSETGESVLVTAMKYGDFEIVNDLIEYNAKLNDINSILLELVTRKSSGIVQLLLEKGANPQTVNQQGNTALLLAIKNKRVGNVKHLIESGADVNKNSKDGMTPLMLAIEQNSDDIVKLLVASKVHVNMRGVDGYTPLIKSVENKNSIIAMLLIKNGANLNVISDSGLSPLMLAIISDDFELVKYMINDSADVNSAASNGMTPLHYAVENSHYDITRLLTESDASLDSADLKGNTPLLYAVDKSDFNLTRLLIESGANVDYKNIQGYSPLMLAVNNHKVNLVRLLVESGANVNEIDSQGESILSKAVKYNQNTVVKILLRNGADINEDE